MTNTGEANVGDGFAGDALITSLSVVCDPRVGDYVARWADSIAGGRPNGGTGTSSIAAYETAGVAMHLRISGVLDGADFETQLRTPDGHYFFVPGDLAAPSRTPPPSSEVGTSIVPGAAAWITPDPAGKANAASRAIWLADQTGARIVGRVPTGAPADLRLNLTEQAVSWTDPDGRHSARVFPVLQDSVTVAAATQ